MDKRSNSDKFTSFVDLAIALQGKEEVEKKMSQVNQRNRSEAGRQGPRLAVSGKGNVQFEKSPEQQLYEALVMTLVGKDSYHETQSDRIDRMERILAEVVAKGNLDFIANAIVYARTEMNIRTMPIVITGLFAKAVRDAGLSYPHMRQLVSDVIQRADQITDMYAVAFMVFGDKKAVPMAIKRGVADAFNKFNEYAFAKYNRNGAVKLRDVLRIVHPKGKDEQQKEIFDRIMKDALEVPYTWETELSRNGQLPEEEQKSKSQLWKDLVMSNQLGYMALLRNLRNILEANVDGETRTAIVKRLADPEQVAKSKQLPFRFVNAYDAISGYNDNRFNNAIVDALDASLGNVPKIGERVWLIVDCSGSMGGWGYSRRGSVLDQGDCPMRTAALFAAALAKAHDGADKLAVTLFSDNAQHVQINTRDSVLGIAGQIMDKVYGGGTNLKAALDLKSTLGFEPDTVVVLSDMQVDAFYRDGYYTRGAALTKSATDIFAKDAVKVAMNLHGYDSTPVHEAHGWIQVSGWSDKVFDFIPAMREGETLIERLSRPYVEDQNAA